ncbi:MAG TPA: polysaccharide deacetylase family protein, partial [Thermoleophilaceae bacterium]
AEFRRQMRALLRAGYRTITQRQLFDAVYRAAALPRRPVIVSVDDGYVDDVTEILPVLRRLRMVATFYVITGRTHEAGFLSARQIRSLERAGMDVGAHTRTHPDLPSLAAEGLRAEVSGSARDLRRILGHPVYWFAYPAGAFDERTIGAVRRAGFLMAVTTQPGSSVSSTAPFAIPRLRVNRSTGVRGVLDLVRDG